MERCLLEMHAEAEDILFRSEPLRSLLHGVPGAGKSGVLYWLRDFFEEVCLWIHGKEFVYLASQNSMAALIDGCTFHSFMGVPFMTTDGVVVNRARQKNEHGTPFKITKKKEGVELSEVESSQTKQNEAEQNKTKQNRTEQNTHIK